MRPKVFKSIPRGLGFIAVLCVAVMGTYWFTFHRHVPEYREAVRATGEFAAARAEMQALVESLQARVELLEQEVKVVREANRRLLLDERRLQEQIAAQREELLFYQRLAAAGGSGKGLDIHSLSLHPGKSSRIFRFVLTLTQNLQKAAAVRGATGFKVLGAEAGRPVSLDWSVLSLEDDRMLDFEFKFFQQLEGRIKLPEKFLPEAVIITLKPDGQDPVTARIEWDDALDTDSLP